jgi:hypothetical protein
MVNKFIVTFLTYFEIPNYLEYLLYRIIGPVIIIIEYLNMSV